MFFPTDAEFPPILPPTADNDFLDTSLSLHMPDHVATRCQRIDSEDFDFLGSTPFARRNSGSLSLTSDGEGSLFDFGTRSRKTRVFLPFGALTLTKKRVFTSSKCLPDHHQSFPSFDYSADTADTAFPSPSPNLNLNTPSPVPAPSDKRPHRKASQHTQDRTLKRLALARRESTPLVRPPMLLSQPAFPENLSMTPAMLFETEPMPPNRAREANERGLQRKIRKIGSLWTGKRRSFHHVFRMFLTADAPADVQEIRDLSRKNTGSSETDSEADLASDEESDAEDRLLPIHSPSPSRRLKINI